MMGSKALDRMASNYQRLHPEFTHQQLLSPLRRMYHYINSSFHGHAGPGARMDVTEVLNKLDAGCSLDTKKLKDDFGTIQSYLLGKPEAALMELQSDIDELSSPELLPAYRQAVSELSKMLRDTMVQEELARARKMLWRYQNCLQDDKKLGKYAASESAKRLDLLDWYSNRPYPPELVQALAVRAKVAIAGFFDSLKVYDESVTQYFIQNFSHLTSKSPETDRVRALYERFPGYKEARAYMQGDIEHLVEEARVAQQVEETVRRDDYRHLVCWVSQAVQDVVCQVRYAEIKGYLERCTGKRTAEVLDVPAPAHEVKGAPQRRKVNFV